MDKLRDDFADRCLAFRTDQGKTQRQIAEAIGTDTSYYGKIERKQLPLPTASTMLALAKAFNVPFRQLFPGPDPDSLMMGHIRAMVRSMLESTSGESDDKPLDRSSMRKMLRAILSELEAPKRR